MLRCWRTFPFTCNANGLSSRMASRLLQRRGVSLVGPAKSTFFALYNAQKQGMCVSACRCPGRAFSSTRTIQEQKKTGDYLAGFREVKTYEGKGEEGEGGKEEEDPFSAGPGQGYLPFPPPFHTFNVVMLLFLANVITYVLMNFSGSDSLRDFIVDHFTLSHENAGKIYPLLTNAFYQENLLQLLIDCWLLWQFGNTMLGFLGNTRMTFFAVLCTLGGSFIHLARQKFELYYGMDPLEVRGRCYGPNPFILGLIGVEGLIFRHLNFIQQPPVPFLVLTAFVMVIDVWRIFTTRPEEHGASTGGALVAYFFWALPTRMLGLDKLTAAL
ncbi:rhomboid-like protein, putative,serine peptidase, Clan S-, family S54, putative [Trypanosoma cruzi]|nr:rhomboid-like protein, putative,serine peptidase, Clan S-, family S54, putative [Trypanosoma cruzi]KAF8284255.1 putative serine peptidase, Clan S-, family S54 [Trypanosoma cruzi]PBJ69368.1 rhomboid-like protein,serine peptidase, Clan S, family S54 [Trypanosoma cruzi cruzi]PWU92353.1 rhomboid-like protein [Trypanosoma cruzi]